MSDVTQLAVEGCADCPFQSSNGYCGHPRAPLFDPKEGKELDPPYIRYRDDDSTTPDWCPARTSPVLVSLKFHRK